MMSSPSGATTLHGQFSAFGRFAPNPHVAEWGSIDWSGDGDAAGRDAQRKTPRRQQWRRLVW